MVTRRFCLVNATRYSRDDSKFRGEGYLRKILINDTRRHIIISNNSRAQFQLAFNPFYNLRKFKNKFMRTDINL